MVARTGINETVIIIIPIETADDHDELCKCLGILKLNRKL